MRSPMRSASSQGTWGHSAGEERYFCFGRVARGVMTVRFTYRGEAIRIIGAGFWRRGKAIYDHENQVHE